MPKWEEVNSTHTIVETRRRGEAKKLPPSTQQLPNRRLAAQLMAPCAILAVTGLIQLLLLMSGIEPNPGPSTVKFGPLATYTANGSPGFYMCALNDGVNAPIVYGELWKTTLMGQTSVSTTLIPNGFTTRVIGHAHGPKAYYWVVAVKSGPFAPTPVGAVPTRFTFPTAMMVTDMEYPWVGTTKHITPNYPAMFVDGIRHPVAGANQWTILDDYGSPIQWPTILASSNDGQRLVVPTHSDDVIILSEGYANDAVLTFSVSPEQIQACWGGDCRIMMGMVNAGATYPWVMSTEGAVSSSPQQVEVVNQNPLPVEVTNDAAQPMHVIGAMVLINSVNDAGQ